MGVNTANLAALIGSRICHDLISPIGAIHNTHHGTTNAVCMPAVLQLNRPAISGRFDQVASYLGISGGFDGFCDFVDTFNASLGIPRRLTDLGVTNPDEDRIVAGALSDPSCGGNPIALTDENLRALLRAVL